MSVYIPSSFSQRVSNTFGDCGVAWLKKLPELIAEAQARFDLQVGAPVADLSHNYTATAHNAAGMPIIIKFCVPSDEVVHEINALKLMQGDAVVQLFDADLDLGVLLLEKIEPGQNLITVASDEVATEIFADLIQKICCKPDEDVNFPTTQEWFARLEKQIHLPDTFNRKHIDYAHGIAQELHQELSDPVLLHGDLHHFNMLSSERVPWLVIDPKGVMGPREYEVGAFLRNPIPSVAARGDAKRILGNRLSILAEKLQFEQQKLAAWGFSQAILACVWSLDAGSKDWQAFVYCAEMLFSYC